jgi:hypothetical protein
MTEPTQAPPQARTSVARIGLLGAAAAALVAIGILAVAATASPSGILASNASSGSSPTTPTPLDGGRWGRGGGPGGGITITAISGSSISLKTVDGWTRTITVDSGTTYSKGGQTISLSDLAVGDEIRFRETLESSGAYSIDAIEVIPPHLAGVVTAVSGSTISLRLPDGSSGTVKVTGSTTYQVGSNSSASLGDVEVGMVLFAEGTRNTDGSLTATAIRAGELGGMRGFGRGPGHGWWGGAQPPSATSSPGTSN